MPVSGETRTYHLPNTNVVDLPTSRNGIDYQLYIHTPFACKNQKKRCPAVYMLDAEYSFALSTQIVSHLEERSRINPVISVAIAYPDKGKYRQFRTRDYTPYFFPTGGYGVELQRESGGGPKFLEVIKTEIIPYVEKHYGASKEQRTLVGHSYGGLFAIYAWVTSPEAFENYIIVSPSLWYADHKPLSDVKSACDTAAFSGERDIYLAVGSHEEQPENNRSMVSDLKKLQRILDACALRKASTHLEVFEDETHASIFPAALSSGLRKHFQ